MSEAVTYTPWKLALMVAGGLAAAGLGWYGLHLRKTLEQEQQRWAQEIGSLQGQLGLVSQGIDARQIEKRRKELDALNAQRPKADVTAAVKAALGTDSPGSRVELATSVAKLPEGRGESLLELRGFSLPVASWPDLLAAYERMGTVRPGCGVFAVRLKTDNAYPERSFDELLVSFGLDYSTTTTARTP